MCTQKPPHDYSEQLYGKYRDAFNTYITGKVRHGGWDGIHASRSPSAFPKWKCFHALKTLLRP